LRCEFLIERGVKNSFQQYNQEDTASGKLCSGDYRYTRGSIQWDMIRKVIPHG
jgi:hypothetical protein